MWTNINVLWYVYAHWEGINDFRLVPRSLKYLCLTSTTIYYYYQQALVSLVGHSWSIISLNNEPTYYFFSHTWHSVGKWCLYLTLVAGEPSIVNLKFGQCEINSSQFNLMNIFWARNQLWLRSNIWFIWCLFFMLNRPKLFSTISYLFYTL